MMKSQNSLIKFGFFIAMISANIPALAVDCSKYNSEQIKHPGYVGLKCGITLGFICPGKFGDDFVQVADDSKSYFTDVSLSMAKNKTEKTFNIWKLIGGFFSVAILMVSLLAAIKVKERVL